MYDYIVKNGDAGVIISTAITILQYKAGSAAPALLLRAWLNQGLSEVSTQEQVQILRKTGAATVTSFTPRKMRPNDPTAAGAGGTSATGYTGSAEGTDGDVLVDEGWNILGGGYVWVPSKEDIWIPAGGIIAMKFPVAPASATWRAGFVIREFNP